MSDAVDHPAHYTAHPSGVECIDVAEHLNFCRGNALKYLWRAGLKGDALTDLRKARWYLDREITRLERGRDSDGGDPGPVVIEAAEPVFASKRHAPISYQSLMARAARGKS